MKKQYTILFIGLSVWLLYFSTIFTIDSLWGINFISFLSPISQILLFSLSLISILLFPKIYDRFKLLKSTFSVYQLTLPLLVVCGLCIYAFPIFKNVYGDSAQFMERLGESTTVFSSKYLYNLISFDLSNPKLGNLTVLSFIRLFSYSFKTSHNTAFIVLGLLSGLSFVWLCLRYIGQNIQNNTLQWLLVIIVILSPFNQLFLGHQEIYAPAFPAAIWYFINLRDLFKNKRKKILLILIISFLICIKLHFTFLLLLPSLVIAIVSYFKNDIVYYLNWRSIITLAFVPFLTLGSCLYFFVFQDYADERFLNPSVDLYDRLFLPILSPEAPLDRYTLFNLNHILDFINMSFLWSGACIFILIVVLFFYRKAIIWHRPEIVLTGVTLLFFITVFFTFNPLLSMPIDFDLFSLTAPILLIFTVFVIEQINTDCFIKSVGGSVIGVSLFSLAIFSCHHHKESLSKRMVSIGKHVFKTYWIRSAGDIQMGITLIEDDPDKYLNNYLEVITDLEPYATKGKDIEYAHMLWSIGKHYRTVNKDYENALKYHLQSEDYSEELTANYIGIMESYYLMNNYTAAYQYSQKLIEENYPSERRALEISIDCALNAGLEQNALIHIESYLSKWESSKYKSIADQIKNS